VAGKELPGDGEAPEINGVPYAGDETPDEELEWPIGFIVILVLAALYLGWRLIQVLARAIDFFG